MPKRLQALTWTPEFNVALFAFLLNQPWEPWQVPLFDHMPLAPHWESRCRAVATGPVAGSAAIADLAGAEAARVDPVQVTRPLVDRIGLHDERWEIDIRVTPKPTTPSGLSASIDSTRRA